jgi:putative intracellular protease/amidase
MASKKKVLVLASNMGLWAEELQGPWDALVDAGHDLQLATEHGNTPLPMAFSMDPEFVDPVQNAKVNPVYVVERTKTLLETGAWDQTIKIRDAKMADYDAIVIVGGPGSPLDLAGNAKVHVLLVDAWQQGKLIGALCYAVGALVWARNPETQKSIIWGKTIVAHPRPWDFTDDMPYPLYGATPSNQGTNLVTPGFLYPLFVIVDDAVGPDGKVLTDPTANHDKPLVHVDGQFVTALSVESSKAFGDALVTELAKR